MIRLTCAQCGATWAIEKHQVMDSRWLKCPHCERRDDVIEAAMQYHAETKKREKERGKTR